MQEADGDGAFCASAAEESRQVSSAEMRESIEGPFSKRGSTDPPPRRSRVMTVAVAWLSAFAAHSLMATLELLPAPSHPSHQKATTSFSEKAAAFEAQNSPKNDAPGGRMRVRGLYAHTPEFPVSSRGSSSPPLHVSSISSSSFSESVESVFLRDGVEFGAAGLFLAQSVGALSGAVVADGVWGRVAALKTGLYVLAPSVCAAGSLLLRRKGEGSAKWRKETRADLPKTGGISVSVSASTFDDWVQTLLDCLCAFAMIFAAWASGCVVVACLCLCFEEPDALLDKNLFRGAGSEEFAFQPQSDDSRRRLLTSETAQLRRDSRQEGTVASSSSFTRQRNFRQSEVDGSGFLLFFQKNSHESNAASNAPLHRLHSDPPPPPPKFSWHSVRPFVLLMASESAARLSVHSTALFALLRVDASLVESEGVRAALAPSLFLIAGVSALALLLTITSLGENPFVDRQKLQATQRLSKCADVSLQERLGLLLFERALRRRMLEEGHLPGQVQRSSVESEPEFVEEVALSEVPEAESASESWGARRCREDLSFSSESGAESEEDRRKTKRNSEKRCLKEAAEDLAFALSVEEAEGAVEGQRHNGGGRSCFSMRRIKACFTVMRRLGLARKTLFLGVLLPAALIASALWSRGVSRALLLEEAAEEQVALRGRREAALRLQRLEAFRALFALATWLLPLLAGKYIPPKPLQIAACVVAAFVAFGFAVSLHTLAASFPEQPPIDSSVSASFLYEVSAQTPDFAPALTCTFLALQTTHTAVRASTAAATFAASKTAGAFALLASHLLARRCCQEANAAFPSCAAQVRALFSCLCYVAAGVCTLSYTPHVRLRKRPVSLKEQHRDSRLSSFSRDERTRLVSAASSVGGTRERRDPQVRKLAKSNLATGNNAASARREQLAEEGRRVLLQHSLQMEAFSAQDGKEGKAGMICILDALHWGDRHRRPAPPS